MNIESEKKKIIEWISEIEDESTIEELKILRDVSVNGSDLWDNLSEEEKKKLRSGGCTKKCVALVSPYLAHIIDAAAIRSQFYEDRQECPEMETIFRKEFIRALDPWREKETLAAGLKDILAI